MSLSADDPELLDALAEHGGRDLVLRQFDAIGAMSELPIPEAVRHLDDVDQTDPDEVAAAAAETFEEWVERDWSDEEYECWKHRVESEYGEKADNYIEAND
jgi:hypothetical protein